MRARLFEKDSVPTVPLPPGQTASQLLRQKAEAGALRIYGSLTPEIQARLEHEITVIARMGFEPIFLIVEDLHWSDDTSLEFLLHLARRIVSQPIFLLLTYRNDETHPALVHFLVELDRERLAMELPLQRLTVAEEDRMLRAILSAITSSACACATSRRSQLREERMSDLMACE